MSFKLAKSFVTDDVLLNIASSILKIQIVAVVKKSFEYLGARIEALGLLLALLPSVF